MQLKPIYLPGLNGIRAMAVIGVVVSHITRQGEDFGLNPYLFGSYQGDTVGWDLAEFGVTMFFALSGFLITYLLLIERDNGSIKAGKFYMRRILRIWPLYYGYILLCVLTWFIFELNVNWNSLGYYILFAPNIPFILSTTMPFLIHYWSLGVEEQFYILWPWFNKLSRRILFWVTIALLLIIVGGKLVLHIYQPHTLFEKFIHISRYHCMLIGALCAMLYHGKNLLFIKLVTNKFVQCIAWAGIALIILNRFHFASVLDNEFVAIITGIIIIGQVSVKGLISLENKVMNAIGKWSYGIYIIHPLLIFLYSKFMKDITPYYWLNYILVYGTIFLSTLVLAALSYNYFEKPFLNLKASRFTVVRSSDSEIHNRAGNEKNN